MPPEQTQALRDQAAVETLERIRGDRQRASRRIAPMVAFIEEHLFDPDLDVNRLKREIGHRQNNIVTVFRQEIGLAPKAYITDCRLEVAGRLLRDTGLRVWQIAYLVGYSDLRTLGQAFTKWSGGLSPSRYRQRIREIAAGETPPGAPFAPRGSAFQDRWNRTPFLRRTVRGELSAEEARPLLAYLHSLYGPAPEPEEPAEERPIFSVDEIDYDRLRAEKLWQHVEDWPAEEQRAYLARRVSFGSRALFDLLRAKSRELGRRSRPEGVRLAELALESLEASRKRLGEQYPNLLAQGWAWLGNARRLALDFLGAEKAFIAAKECWATPRTLYDRQVEAETSHLESCLRMFQNRFAEALELEQRAIQILRLGHDEISLARSLVQRASIIMLSGKPLAAISDLEEAHRIGQNIGQDWILLATSGNIAFLYTQVKNYKKAVSALRKANGIARGIGSAIDPTYRYQLDWTEGLISRGTKDMGFAEKQLLASRTGFASIGQDGHAAVVSLDLAILYLEQGRSAETIVLIAEIIPVLQTLDARQEIHRALVALEQAATNTKITLSILRRVREMFLQHLISR